MSEENEKQRIINAKYRITKFTLDNEHLTRMIEELKKEISTVEANRAKLLSQLEEPGTKSAAPQQVLSDSLLMQYSSFSDITDSSLSFENSDLVVNESLNNSGSNECDWNSKSPVEFGSTSTEDKEQSISNSDNVPSINLMLDCVNCVESLLSNLKVIKKCLRTDLCDNCRRLGNEISTLQEMDVVSPQASVNRDCPNSVTDIEYREQRTDIINSISSGLSSLCSLFNFVSNPFLFLFVCGYIGVLVYAKQANSHIVVTPPQ